MNNEDLPYERYKHLGADSLSEAELLAIIIRTGTRECSSVELGKKVLELADFQQRGLGGLHTVSLQELQSIKGIGEVKAIKIKCLAELSLRMVRHEMKERLQFCKPALVAEYYMEELRYEQKEKVLLLLLDNKMRLIEKYVLSIGTINASLVSPRDVFLHALRAQAVFVMLLHNHPSGDPTPSRQDLAITKKIKEIGAMIDIPLMDHIIIGDNRYTSFKEASLL